MRKQEKTMLFELRSAGRLGGPGNEEHEMQETPFIEVVKGICTEDPRYHSDSYAFVRESLDFTAKMLKKPAEGTERHLTGQELLEGIRKYALEEFGPMARTVLNEWGVKRTEDFGEIVFNLVEAGTLGKTKDDKREDFANGYDFHEAFSKPFIPASTPAPRRNIEQRTTPDSLRGGKCPHSKTQ